LSFGLAVINGHLATPSLMTPKAYAAKPLTNLSFGYAVINSHLAVLSLMTPKAFADEAADYVVIWLRRH
jgi:hypothetical protein